MTARGVDFLASWIERHVLPRSCDRPQASRLARKLEFDAGFEGLMLEELEIEPGELATYIWDAIVHVGEPGTPGD
jgi:hypothetical protein